MPYDFRQSPQFPVGYGTICWPDYEKGWRYGKPFATDEKVSGEDIEKMYYVKTAACTKPERSVLRK